MTLELGEVIASIGGDGGDGPAPTRHVYDLDDMPITTDGRSWLQVPDVPDGAALVATLEWAGPETGGPAVVLQHGSDMAFGMAFNMGMGMGFVPITIVSTASGPQRGQVVFTASAEGFTATSLTAIIIPTINEAT